MFTVSLNQLKMLQVELLPSLRMPGARTKAANQVELHQHDPSEEIYNVLE